LQTKAGKDLEKRDLTLADSSGATVTCTLWGDKANGVYDAGDVVALKGVRVGEWWSPRLVARVHLVRRQARLSLRLMNGVRARFLSCAGEYGGRSLSTSFSSMIDRNPDTDAGECSSSDAVLPVSGISWRDASPPLLAWLPSSPTRWVAAVAAAAHKLIGWYKTIGGEAAVASLKSLTERSGGGSGGGDMGAFNTLELRKTVAGMKDDAVAGAHSAQGTVHGGCARILVLQVLTLAC